MAGGKDTSNHPNRSVTRTKPYGYVGEMSKDMPKNSQMKDDPGLTPVEVGSTPATPQKGYFPVVAKKEIGDTTVYANDKKRTRFGAKRQAKKNVQRDETLRQVTTKKQRREELNYMYMGDKDQGNW